MYILNPKRVAIMTASILFFVLTTVFNILCVIGYLPFNKTAINIVFLMLSLAAVCIVIQVRDYLQSNASVDVEFSYDVDFLTQQIRFICVTSVSFLIWLL